MKLFKFFFAFIFVIMLMTSVDASKSFDEETNTYKTKDFLIFKKYDISLDYVSDSVINGYAGGTLVMHKDSKVFKHLYYENSVGQKGQFKKENGEGYKIFINTSTLWFRKVNKSYKYEDCVPQFILGEERACKHYLDSWDWEPYYASGWEEIDITQKIPEGSYKWKMEVRKPRNRIVDFIITTDDEGDLSEWAWFNSTFTRKKRLDDLIGQLPSFNITYDADMQPDFDDLRFLNFNETIELNYTVRLNVSSTWAYVTIDTSNQSNQTVAYMYYSNPTVGTTQINITEMYRDPVNLYQFDESTPIDTTGHSDATNAGASPFEPGPVLFSYGFGGDTVDLNFDQIQINQFDSYVVFFKFSVTADTLQYVWDVGNTEFSWRFQGTSQTAEWQIFNGGYVSVSTAKSSWNVDQFYSIALSFDSTTGKRIYIDGVLDNSTADTVNTGPGDASDPFVIGERKGGSNVFTGDFDEMIFINRSMTSDEIIDLMSMVNQSPIFGPEEMELELTVNLTQPDDGILSGTGDIDFSCTCTDTVNCTGLNMTIDDVLVNQTTAIGNLTLNFTNASIPDGTFFWYCTGRSAVNITNSTIFNFTVDTTEPLVTITNPVNGSLINSFNESIDLNWTIIDFSTDACYYTFETIENITLNDGKQISSTTSEVMLRGWILVDDRTTQNFTSNFSDNGGGSMDIFIQRKSNNATVRDDIQTIQQLISNTVEMNLSDNGLHYFEVEHSSFASSVGSIQQFGTSSPIANATFNVDTVCALNTTVINYPITNPPSVVITLFANDTFGNIGFDNTTIFLSTNAPIVNITFPTNNFDSLSANEEVDLNWTIFTNGTLDVCFFNYNNVNTTVTCSTNTTDFNYSVGANSITLFVNDTLGNFAQDTQAWNVTLIEINQTFETPVTEGSTQAYVANVNITSGLTITAVNLVYDGVATIGSFSQDGTVFNLNINNFVVPGVLVDSNLTFFWSLTLSDSSVANLSTQSQMVLTIALDNCSAFTFVLFNYTMVDEDSQDFINGATENVSLEIALQLFTADKSSLIFNFSTEFVGTNPNAICSEINLFNDSSYIIDSTAKYSSDPREIEYYNIRDSVIQNGSTVQNITLFDLLTTRSTSFQITFKDSNFVVVENALIQVNRQYVSEGIFKTVEIPITDSNGQTVAHLVEDTIVYNFIVSKEGEVIGLFNNLIAFCEDATIGQCFITLNALEGTGQVFNPDDSSQTSFLPLSFNETTRDLRLTYTTNDGSVKTVLMNAVKLDQIGNVSVCSATVTSASGTLICNIPASFGNETIIVDVFVNSALTITQYFSAGGDIDLGFGGFFIMLFFVVSIGLMMAESKSMVVIGIMLGFVVASLLYLTEGGVFAGITSIIWLIINGLILVWKLNQENTT